MPNKPRFQNDPKQPTKPTATCFQDIKPVEVNHRNFPCAVHVLRPAVALGPGEFEVEETTATRSTSRVEPEVRFAPGLGNGMEKRKATTDRSLDM